MNSWRFLIALWPALIVLNTSPVKATVVRSATLEELASASAVIVHAVVRDVNDHLTDDPEGPFLTNVTLEVVEAIKGVKKPDAILHITLPGGQAGDRTMHIPGMPTFVPYDEVVLLLESNSQSILTPIGLAQGVFFVDRGVAIPKVIRSTRDLMILPPRDATKAGREPTDAAGREATGGEINGFAPAPHTLDGLLKSLRTFARSTFTSGRGAP